MDAEGCEALDFAAGCCAKTKLERNMMAHMTSVAINLYFVFSLKLFFIISLPKLPSARMGTLPCKQFAVVSQILFY